MAGESPISNWVVLEPGIPRQLHFADHRIVERRITDPISSREKTVQSLQFDVDWMDGSPVDKTFSVVSQRLAGELGPWLAGKAYRARLFTIVKEAAGTVAPRLSRVEPWTR